MKKITILLLFFFTNCLFSQIIPLLDTTNDEIYGYLVFQKVEKVDKKENRYMANLLDINLNRVAQSTFTDKDKIKIGNVHYNGKSIYFELIPTSTLNTKIQSSDFSYRIYNLEKNKISDRYELPEVDKKTLIRGSYPIHGEGFGIMLRNYKSQINEFYAISDDNRVLYKTHPYGNPKKKKGYEHIEVGDIHENLLVTINEKNERMKGGITKSTIMLTDVATGKSIKEIDFDSEDFDIYISDVQVTDTEIYVFGDSYEKKKNILSGKTAGLFKATLDLEGNILNKKNVVWADIQSKIDIKEGGFVRGKGYIYTHRYVLDKNTNHTIVVGEYIKGALTSVSVEDMIFLDFDENFNLDQVFEVSTNKSILSLGGIKMGGSRDFGHILKSHNYFDYRFNNFLEEKSGLSFFYFNIEKLRMFSGEFSHGMVVYKDGKFSANKLKWETSAWRKDYMNLLPSKPGYILLSKISKDKILENRLERLEY